MLGATTPPRTQLKRERVRAVAQQQEERADVGHRLDEANRERSRALIHASAQEKIASSTLER